MSAEPHPQAPERPGVDTARILWAACGVLLFLAGAIAMLDAFYIHDVPVRTVAGPQTFPEPRLRTDEPAQLQQTLAAQRERLGTYRWADENHNTVQIPIERAMQIIVHQGTYGPLIASNPIPSSPPTAAAGHPATPAGASLPAPGVGRSSADPAGRPSTGAGTHQGAGTIDGQPPARSDPNRTGQEKVR